MQLILLKNGYSTTYVNADRIVSIRPFPDKVVITTTVGKIAIELEPEEFFKQLRDQKTRIIV